MPESQNDLCFVIMPFGDRLADSVHFDKMETLYSQFIKPSVESIKQSGSAGIKLRCHRADKELGPGDIIDHIIESLVTARIVIADLTGKNPNVFYELGVRHAVSNATVLIAEGTQHIPFDVHNLRAIIYEYSPGGMIRFQAELKDALHKIISSPNKIDNPVRRMLYHKESAKLVSKHAPPGFDVIQSLLIEVSSVRDEIRNQRHEIELLLQSLTQAPHSKSLQRFEGIWESPETNGIYCMKVIDNELRVAYDYGGENTITSHFYNCRVIGDVLACRFEWFREKDLKGFIFLRFISPDTLQGGWCLTGELPEMIGDISASATRNLSVPVTIDPESPLLTRLELHRTAKRRFPRWAERYFEQYE